MSHYSPPYVVAKNNNIKVVLNLSGYAKEGDLEYLKTKNSIEKKILCLWLRINILTKQLAQKISRHGNLWECLMKYLNL